jgi:hypothetical protein
LTDVDFNLLYAKNISTQFSLSKYVPQAGG